MTNSPTSLSAFDYLKLDDLEQIVLTEAQHRRDTNRIADMYPDEGPLRRELFRDWFRILAAASARAICISFCACCILIWSSV